VAARGAQLPYQNTQLASAILAGLHPSEPIITDSNDFGFAYYLGHQNYHILTGPDVERWFCLTTFPFVYIEFADQAHALNRTCLHERNANYVLVPQSDAATLAIWFVPALDGRRLGPVGPGGPVNPSAAAG
jgi:hypothetical protein